MKKIATKKAAKKSAPDSPWVIGESYFIRTVTMHLIGRLTAVYPTELVLENATWVADSSRFHNALRDGKLSETEPFLHPVIVGRGAVVDATLWPHSLEIGQK